MSTEELKEVQSLVKQLTTLGQFIVKLINQYHLILSLLGKKKYNHD